MKDKIIEIKKVLEFAIEVTRLWHNMGGKEPEATQMWNIYKTQSPEMKRINNALKLCDEILALPLYEKEFVEWISFGSHPFVAWFDENGHYFMDEIEPKRWSIDELYDYWQQKYLTK